MVRDLSSTCSETAFSAYCSQQGPRPLEHPVRETTRSERPSLSCLLKPTWSETSQVPGPRPAFCANCSQNGPRPFKYPVRDRFQCLQQPTWSETSPVPGPRPLLGPTAANMVRDLSSTRTETAFIAYCSQHGSRPLKHPVRDRC